jgi:hypothetical protein
MSNSIGGFQSQNSPYPAPSSTAPAPKKPSLPTWEIVAALGATTVAVAGGVYAYRNSSKSSNTAPFSLGHDSIDASGDDHSFFGQNYGQAQIDARQARENQPVANATPRSAPVALAANMEGNLAEPEVARNRPAARLPRQLKVLFRFEPEPVRFNGAGPIRPHPPAHHLAFHPFADHFLMLPNEAPNDLNEDILADLAELAAHLENLPQNHPLLLALGEELRLIEEHNRRQAYDNRWRNRQENPAQMKFQLWPAQRDHLRIERQREDRQAVAMLWRGNVHATKNVNNTIKIYQELVEDLTERGLFDADYSPETAEEPMREIQRHIETWANNEYKELWRLRPKKTDYDFNVLLYAINRQKENACNSLRALVQNEPLLPEKMRAEFPNMHPRHVLLSIWKLLKALDSEAREQMRATDKDETLLLSTSIGHLVKALNDADASGVVEEEDRICGSGQIEQLTHVYHLALGKNLITAKSAKLYADSLYSRRQHNDDLYRIMNAKDREALATFIMEKSQEEDDNEEIDVENPEGKALSREVVDEYLDNLLPPDDHTKRETVWKAMKDYFEEPACVNVR